MRSHRLTFTRRRAEKFALDGLRLALAVIVSSLGLAFLTPSRLAEDLSRIGYGPEFLRLLGASHLLGGMALLVPRTARVAAPWLGLFIAAVALYLRAEGAGVVTAVPALLVSILFLFGIGLSLRHRVDTSAWHERLERYADQGDSR